MLGQSRGCGVFGLTIVTPSLLSPSVSAARRATSRSSSGRPLVFGSRESPSQTDLAMTSTDNTPVGDAELGHVRLLHKLEALDEAIDHLESSRSPNRDASLVRLRQLRSEMLTALGLGGHGSSKTD
jgi:hypothetical protein